MPLARLSLARPHIQACSGASGSALRRDPAYSDHKQPNAPINAEFSFYLARTLLTGLFIVGGSNPDFGYEKAPANAGALFVLFGAPGSMAAAAGAAWPFGLSLALQRICAGAHISNRPVYCRRFESRLRIRKSPGKCWGFVRVVWRARKDSNLRPPGS